MNRFLGRSNKKDQDVPETVPIEVDESKNNQENKDKKLKEKPNQEEDDDDNENVFKPSKNYRYRIPKERLILIKEIFDTYDEGLDGHIKLDVLGDVLRACGVLISNKDINDLKTVIAIELDCDKKEHKTIDLDLHTFLMHTARKLSDTEKLEKTTRKAFSKLYINPDSKDHEIPLNNLRSSLVSYGGEHLKEDEIDTLTYELKNKNLVSEKNFVNINSLVDLLNTPLEAMIEEIENNLVKDDNEL